MGDLERYLAGLPLNDENAALMEGRDPALEFAFSGEVKAKETLTDEERDWLRRLLHEPGFTILIKLLNSAVTNREESARVASLSDPLGKRDQIINEWAYVACFRKVLDHIQLIVKNSLEM